MNLRVLKAPNEIVPFTDPRITWPKLGSVKYDGFRILAICGREFYTPSGKPHVNNDIPNHWSAFWTWCNLNKVVIDAEIWSPVRSFSELSHYIRSHDVQLPDDIGLYVFDMIALDAWANDAYLPMYLQRYHTYMNQLCGFPRVFPVEQVNLETPSLAEARYNFLLENNHEGIILRSPTAFYKHGRCTHNEDHIFKFKNFETQDAVIIGWEQMQRLRDDAEIRINSFGLIERSSRQDDYQPSEELGAFYVTQDGGKTVFKITPGKGFTMDDRATWWKNRDNLIGKGVEFQYMPHGSKDAPRMGRLVRFRPDKDCPDIKIVCQPLPPV